MYPLPAKTPTEEKLVTFDFTIEAVSGSVLSGPIVEKSVITGDDPAAAGLTVGTAIVSGLQAQAMVSGGLDGVTYLLTCTVDASNGEVHQILASLLVSNTAA